MAFIRTVPENQASPELSQMYAKDQEALGYIPNTSRVFSHRPQVMGAWSNSDYAK